MYNKTSPMIKFTILLKRNPAMTHRQFVEHHKTVHAPLFASRPVVRAQVRRYVQQHTLPVEMPGLPAAKYDGITELWFDDAEGIAALFNDSDYLARIRPDEERFLNLHGCDFVISQENAVF
jgi:uncharacterized protein (TIGR02118 family)